MCDTQLVPPPRTAGTAIRASGPAAPAPLALRRRAPAAHFLRQDRRTSEARRFFRARRVAGGAHAWSPCGGRKERVLAHPEAVRSCENRDQPVTTTTRSTVPAWEGGSHTSLGRGVTRDTSRPCADRDATASAPRAAAVYRRSGALCLLVDWSSALRAAALHHRSSSFGGRRAPPR